MVSSFSPHFLPHRKAAMAPSTDGQCPAPMATQKASRKPAPGGRMTSPHRWPATADVPLWWLWDMIYNFMWYYNMYSIYIYKYICWYGMMFHIVPIFPQAMNLRSCFPGCQDSVSDCRFMAFAFSRYCLQVSLDIATEFLRVECSLFQGTIQKLPSRFIIFLSWPKCSASWKIEQ